MAANARTLGAEYVLSTKVKTIALGSDAARIEAETDGQASHFEGKVVVVASGFGSGLPDSLGFGRVGDFVMGAQAEVETSVDEVEVYLGSRLAPGFFAWLVPTHEGRALAGLLARRDTRAHMEAFLRHLKDQGKTAIAARRRSGSGAFPSSPCATPPATGSSWWAMPRGRSSRPRVGASTTGCFARILPWTCWTGQ